jgi:cysteine-rich repeat protein
MAAGEGCDDGNTMDGDGCSGTCAVETCVVAGLEAVTGVTVVKVAAGARVSWLPSPGAAEYHANSVPAKAGLLDPRRAPGPAAAECEAVAPLLSCVDADAFDTPSTLYYQVLAACGPTGGEEGPF